MNKERRQQITEIIEWLEDAQSDIEIVKDDEEEYRDDIPENLQGSEKYDNANAACDWLDEAYESLGIAIAALDDARGC